MDPRRGSAWLPFPPATSWQFCIALGLLFEVVSLQDEMLKKLVEEHGTDDWAFIASHLQVSRIFVSLKFPFTP